MVQTEIRAPADADAVGREIKRSCLEMPLHRAGGTCWQPAPGQLWEMQDSFLILGDFVKREGGVRAGVLIILKF